MPSETPNIWKLSHWQLTFSLSWPLPFVVYLSCHTIDWVTETVETSFSQCWRPNAISSVTLRPLLLCCGQSPSCCVFPWPLLCVYLKSKIPISLRALIPPDQAACSWPYLTLISSYDHCVVGEGSLPSKSLPCTLPGLLELRARGAKRQITNSSGE